MTPGVSPVPAAELEPALNEKLRECGADLGCLSTALAGANLDLAVLAVVNLALDPALTTMRMIDLRTNAALEAGPTEHGRDARSTIATINRDFTTLLDRAGFPPGAKLEVETVPAAATVELNPAAPAPPVANVFVVPPGTYRVAANRAGFAETATITSLGALESRRVKLALAEQPEELADSFWFWAGIAGLVAGGATVAAVAALDPGARDRLAICQGRALDQCMR